MQIPNRRSYARIIFISRFIRALSFFLYLHVKYKPFGKIITAGPRANIR